MEPAKTGLPKISPTRLSLSSLGPGPALDPIGHKLLPCSGDFVEEEWDQKQAYRALRHEFNLHGLSDDWHSESTDTDNPLGNLFNEVMRLINGCGPYCGPYYGSGLIVQVSNSVKEAAIAFYDGKITTREEIADMLPSHAKILAVRFFNPYKQANASICRFLVAMGQAHLLQITALGPIQATSPNALIAQTLAAKAEAHLDVLQKELTHKIKCDTLKLTQVTAQIKNLGKTLESAGLKDSKVESVGKGPVLNTAQSDNIIDLATAGLETSRKRTHPNPSSATQVGTWPFTPDPSNSLQQCASNKRSTPDSETEETCSKRPRRRCAIKRDYTECIDLDG
ncbi:hypothetical protein G7Z17_g11473 [Cylindrodendrum hubeiense]|uniref:Uncharacterized protein n=1 Tax=Cylindrodendrum hubeiense TaxID=595255 RepID=A0A9P5H509_9HYPO|nr:hypothetical protein G7Z17_g11473 [Cylindrodendrum hubeiense]